LVSIGRQLDIFILRELRVLYTPLRFAGKNIFSYRSVVDLAIRVVFMHYLKHIIPVALSSEAKTVAKGINKLFRLIFDLLLL
jgi:hypothetical protein